MRNNQGREEEAEEEEEVERRRGGEEERRIGGEEERRRRGAEEWRVAGKHHALVKQQRAHRLRYENVDMRQRQLQLLDAAVCDVDGGGPAVAVDQALRTQELRERGSKRGGRRGPGTVMSAAMSEPSTEYTLAAPAVCAKKDSMHSLLHIQHSKASNTTTGTHNLSRADVQHAFAPEVARVHRHCKTCHGCSHRSDGTLACTVIDAGAHDIPAA